MADRQYIPFSHKINNISLIIYPAKDENPVYDVFKNKGEIKKYLNELFARHPEINRGEYHIIFVWNLENQRMADIWVHSMKNWSDSGPMIECYIFKGLEICNDAGIASGDGIIVLGREEELRRKIGKLEEYVNREKYIPEFLDEYRPVEEYKD